jgi:deazaflavin-dependent oxidoreductase (nitroreductase family)
MNESPEFKPYTHGQEKFGEWIIKKIGRWQTRVYEWTGGRVWHKFLGSECAILTTTGRKSGEPRKTPLLFLREGDDVIMVASKGGMTTLPLWYRNIEANSTVHIQIGKVKKQYIARDADAAEADSLWPKLDEVYDGYAEYRARLVGKRGVPVVIFTPHS